MQKIRELLAPLRDAAYADFQRKLMPNVAPERVLGVRVPQLRALARQLYGSPFAAEFLQELPHETYDEDNLHAFLICRICDYSEAVAAVDAFLPYVDNWATCDMMSPQVFGKHLPQLHAQCSVWIAAGTTYSVRFGLEMLMRWFLDAAFSPEDLVLAASVNSEQYYVNMMLAWYFATALAKQYDSTLLYLQGNQLDKWVHNKTIQKAVESRRITDEQKKYLRSLRVK